MPNSLGDHAPRLAAARALLTPKGRRGTRFIFEGATLLDEARRSGLAIAELYATEAAYAATPLLEEAEAAGTPLWIVSPRAAGRLSDVESPSGIAAVAERRLEPLQALLQRQGIALVLADLADPGNAGTLLRSADAFGAAGVIFGAAGVDPYHPKVVRAAMGALFRLPVAVAAPADLAKAAASARRPVAGLASDAPQEVAALPRNAILVVGQERRGLGPWEGICEAHFRIPMAGRAESLNAGVAGSIALYEASRRPPE